MALLLVSGLIGADTIPEAICGCKANVKSDYAFSSLSIVFCSDVGAGQFYADPCATVLIAHYQ